MLFQLSIFARDLQSCANMKTISLSKQLYVHAYRCNTYFRSGEPPRPPHGKYLFARVLFAHFSGCLRIYAQPTRFALMSLIPLSGWEIHTYIFLSLSPVSWLEGARIISRVVRACLLVTPSYLDGQYKIFIVLARLIGSDAV